MKELKESLITYGFSENESDVYLYLLLHQDSPAYSISKEVQIPRTTVYKTLEDLEKQGVISSWIKNGVHHYSAENPEVIRKMSIEKQKTIEQVMPEMLNMFKSKSFYPSAKLYVGKEGVKHVFENILETIKDKKIPHLYVYSDYHLTEQFPQYFSNWRKRKNKTKAFTYLIVPYGTPNNDDYSSNEFRETRVMPESFPFEGSIDICGSHVAFFSFKEKEIYSITIDSPIISEMLTKFFLYMWGTLKDKI